MSGPLHRAPRAIVLAWYDGVSIEVRNFTIPNGRWVPVDSDITPDFSSPRLEWRIKHVPIVEEARMYVHMGNYMGRTRVTIRTAEANITGLRGVHCTVTITDGQVTKVESDQTTPA